MDVRDAIDQLSVNASAGPDGIPAVLLKEARDNLSEPLTILWTKSLETGEIPDIFKMAYITPVHYGFLCYFCGKCFRSSLKDSGHILVRHRAPRTSCWPHTMIMLYEDHVPDHIL